MIFTDEIRRDQKGRLYKIFVAWRCERRIYKANNGKGWSYALSSAIKEPLPESSRPFRPNANFHRPSPANP